MGESLSMRAAQRKQKKAVQDDALHRRLKKYGNRGFVKVKSAEGASVSSKAAKNLAPAG